MDMGMRLIYGVVVLLAVGLISFIFIVIVEEPHQRVRTTVIR